MFFFVFVQIQQLLVPEAFFDIIRKLHVSQSINLGLNSSEPELVLFESLSEDWATFLKGQLKSAIIISFLIARSGGFYSFGSYKD